ncbi:MAG TPA: alpha/beta fold hydrolase [Rhizobiaceae bacterium]|nr:alpha/beta fold hydrolase [Rhizobiaceae bacterium]
MADRLFAAEAGKGAETVVLLHGFGGHHDIWRYMVDVLAREYRTLAYDLPGHGRSLGIVGAGSAKSTIAALRDDLAHRALDRVHLVGHSMGGAFAALFAIADPFRIASLTLLAPGGFGEAIAAHTLKRYAEAVSSIELRPYFKAMRGVKAEDDDAALDRLAAVRATHGQREALIEIHGRIARDGKQGAIPREQLAGLKMPVTVAWGTGDGVLPVVQSLNLPPRFHVRIVDGAGHMLPETHPRLCADLVARNVRAAQMLATAAN